MFIHVMTMIFDLATFKSCLPQDLIIRKKNEKAYCFDIIAYLPKFLFKKCN